MAIATTSIAVAAGSANPLVAGCRLRWPNSASDGMVNLLMPLVVAITTTFSLLATCRGGGMIGTHLCGFH